MAGIGALSGYRWHRPGMQPTPPWVPQGAVPESPWNDPAALSDKSIDVRNMGIYPTPNYDGQGRPSFDQSPFFQDPTYKLNTNDAPRDHAHEHPMYLNARHPAPARPDVNAFAAAILTLLRGRR